MAHRGSQRPPRRHAKAFTYEPKIPAVKVGLCCQTIRPFPKDPAHEVRVGDRVLFHGWEGRPYYSPWSWRLEVRVSEVLNISAIDDGIIVRPPGAKNTTLKKWDSPWCRKLAERDYLDPPSGLRLRGLLLSQRKKTEVVKRFQVIRWATPRRGTLMNETKKTTRKRKAPVKKQPPAKKVPAKKGVNPYTEDELRKKHGPRKKPAPKPRKRTGKAAAGDRKKALVPEPVPKTFQDQRHHPKSEPVEKHLYYTKFEAGTMSATINHEDIVKMMKGVSKVAGTSVLTPPQKRAEYNRRVKGLIGPKIRFEDESYFDKMSHKDFAAIVKMVKERVPFKEPNRHLDDFVHE